MILNRKEKNMIISFVTELMEKMNYKLNSKFQFDDYPDSDLAKSEFIFKNKDENVCWRKYKRLQKEGLGGLGFFASYSTWDGVRVTVYFKTNDIKKLIRKEKLQKLSSC